MLINGFSYTYRMSLPFAICSSKYMMYRSDFPIPYYKYSDTVWNILVSWIATIDLTLLLEPYSEKPFFSQPPNIFSLYLALHYLLPDLRTLFFFFFILSSYTSFFLTAVLKEFHCCIVTCELDCFTLLVPAVFTWSL